MRQLKDLTVKGMALVKSPANKKHFLLRKSEESPVAEAEQPEQEQTFKAAPDSVRDAVRAVALAKGADEDATDALECVAHLVHAQKGLTLADLLAAGQAAGLTDVVKAKSKMDMEDEDDDGDNDEESEDGLEGADEEDEPAKGKGHPALPPEINRKVTARKAEEPYMSEEKAQPQQAVVTKSEYDAVLEQVTKAHERIEKFERDEALRVEKAANQGAYGELNLDHDALARTTLSLRKSAPEDLTALEATLKAANEQVRVAKGAGNSIFRPSSRQGAAASVAKSQGDRFKQMVDEHIAKNAGTTRQQAIAHVAKSAEAIAAYHEDQGDN